MGRFVKDIKTKNLEQTTAKDYLDEKIYKNLEKSMSELLQTIEKNGEFEKYVTKLADRYEREQRAIRRRAREAKRIEMGDEYETSEEEFSGSKESDWSAEEDESNEEYAEMLSPS